MTRVTSPAYWCCNRMASYMGNTIVILRGWREEAGGAATDDAQCRTVEDCFEVMLQSRLSDGTEVQLSETAASLLLPVGVAGTTPSSISEPA